MNVYVLEDTLALGALFLVIDCVAGTYRYYGEYLVYGSGDTMITVYHAHGGPQVPNRKWNVECLDGEAVVGIADWWDDFERLEQVWCKFTFDMKPPTSGLYPYYSGCHVRNFTTQFFCFNPLEQEKTSNTFVTAVWNASYFWFVYRPGTDDKQPYKCCKTPPGYYIDYMSCYYMATHDPLFEYYDNTFNYIVYCSTGYVVTGLSKKLNQYSHEYQIDWIQCCRVGLGRKVGMPPPVNYSPSGTPSYYAPGSSRPSPIGSSYSAQYRADVQELRVKQRSDLLANQTHDWNSGQPRDSEARPVLRQLLARFNRTMAVDSDLEKDIEYHEAKKRSPKKPNRKHPSAVR